MKPHLFKTHYPKLKRSYWRVSPMAKPYHKNREAWTAAHEFAIKANLKQAELDQKESQPCE